MTQPMRKAVTLPHKPSPPPSIPPACIPAPISLYHSSYIWFYSQLPHPLITIPLCLHARLHLTPALVTLGLAQLLFRAQLEAQHIHVCEHLGTEGGSFRCAGPHMRMCVSASAWRKGASAHACDMGGRRLSGSAGWWKPRHQGKCSCDQSDSCGPMRLIHEGYQ
jgi:hypothetical protein